jgi:hypothetical protein
LALAFDAGDPGGFRGPLTSDTLLRDEKDETTDARLDIVGNR